MEEPSGLLRFGTASNGATLSQDRGREKPFFHIPSRHEVLGVR